MMCGLTGFFQSGGCSTERATATLDTMATAIVHRGPDDSGLWFDTDAGISLTHRRLSILDLSPAGHQPMHSASGRYVMVFNGEIYNYQELRRELELLPSPLSPLPQRGEGSIRGAAIPIPK